MNIARTVEGWLADCATCDESDLLVPLAIYRGEEAIADELVARGLAVHADCGYGTCVELTEAGRDAVRECREFSDGGFSKAKSRDPLPKYRTFVLVAPASMVNSGRPTLPESTRSTYAIGATQWDTRTECRHLGDRYVLAIHTTRTAGN